MDINKKTLTMGFIASTVASILVGALGDALKFPELTFLALLAAGSVSFYAWFLHKGWFQ